jgi:glycosyltransferase involved in cell wall biosynthesis
VKVAYAVARYGEELRAGAELGTRMLAEHLVADRGCDVEVFTTCAREMSTWADEYPSGTVTINGVTVHRYPSVSGRATGFERFSDGVMARPAATSMSDAERWIELQGPVCPDVLAAAEASDADVVVFYPYLYWPAVHGVRRLRDRAVLHPATHDEWPTRLPVFQEVFASPGGLVFQTHDERRLTERLFPRSAGRRQAVIGLGVDDGPGDAAAAREALGVGERPYLLYVGRVDDGKGTTLLARYFASYKQRHPGPLALVLAGSVVDRPPVHPDIVTPGPVDEDVKWGGLRGAVALVQPSPNESFSLILLEAMAAGRPALVNGSCLATSEHARRSGAGLWFSGYGTFEGALDRILGDRATRDAMGAAGRAYVDRLYRWPRLIGRYADFLTQIAEHRPLH